MTNILGEMFGRMKRAMGLAPLEKMAKAAGAPAIFRMGGEGRMTPDNYNKKHAATAAKIMPGIHLSAVRPTERPIGGRQMTAYPLFNKRGM